MDDQQQLIETEPPPFDFDLVDSVATIDIIHRRDHKFVKRGEGGRKSPGCAVCGRGKTVMVHVGAPVSLNVGGSGHDHRVYQSMKQNWEERLIELLNAAELQRPLARAFVEGQVCFDTRRKRDQGNYRFLVEKALGDALVNGGWLEDDDWDHYEFGRLRHAYEKGKSWTALTIYPTLVEEAAWQPSQ